MTNRWKAIALVFVVIAVTAVLARILVQKEEHGMSTFVITETGAYTSLDPLDGDSSQNLPVARMLYATPIEIFADNTLGSSVLESFEYDRASKTIHWVVRGGLTYSDGSAITPDDVAFSVARMAFARPGFPLIKLIKGLEAWTKGPSPLKKYPEGIKVEGNRVTIMLTEDYPHPLFRFCLELFGIIPKKCVDLETNKIICDKIPTSGYYALKDNAERTLTFEKRPGVDLIQNKKYPNQIRFLYRDIKETFEDPSLQSDSTVILSSEAKLTQDELKQYASKYEIGFTPAAWFTLLQLNPNVPPFDDVDCRLEFAKIFRRNFSKMSGQPAEGSVFTKLVPGYKGYEDLLSNAVRGQDDKSQKCAEKFKKSSFPWRFEKSTSAIFIDALMATTKELGIEVSRYEVQDRKEEVDNFIAGKSALTQARTGFWALDPTGDIQMLFTPNLHEVLKFFWADEKLQSYLKKIVKDGEVNMTTVDDINNYLFADAKFNVYSHIRRFYASKNKNLVRHLPIGITSPSPWHLFGER